MLAEPVERLSPVTTSGSTGQPLQVLRSVRDQAQVSALWARVLHAFGHRFFDSQVNINTGRCGGAHGPVALLRRLGAAAGDPPHLELRAGGPADRDSPRAAAAYASAPTPSASR